MRLPSLLRARPARILALSLGVSIAAAVLLLVGFRTLRSGALPGTTVSGVEVGGLEGEELRDALAEAGDAGGERGLEVVRIGAGGTERARYTRAEAGYGIDIEATARRVLERGRQANPLAALGDHLRATFGGFEVAAVQDIDATEFDEWLTTVVRDLSEPVFPGGLEIEGTSVATIQPEEGYRIRKNELRTRTMAHLGGRAPGEIEVDARSVPPPTDAEDVERVAEDARKALSGTVTLSRNGESLTLAPEELAPILRTKVVTGAETRLGLRVKPKDLRSLVNDPERFGSAPVDASFEVSGDGVSIVPSRPGFSFSARRAARQLVPVALSEDRTAEMKGKKVPADFSSKDAKDMNITEQVSTFTTYHSCCEPRVSNIHTIADIVDGTVVEPGETYSLNDSVGPRTTAKGFVAAPSIRDGEFVAEVGGGISQFATTFFNAIFFGGYDFLEYQAHSYYISRYPRGREATISTPAPDLAFLNDSDAGIYIDTSYTDTSITVSFYGSTDIEISAIMGEPFNTRPPEEQCRVNKALEKGEERTIQSGITGFDVVVERVFDPGDRVETFTTHYQSQPRIVERRRCP